MAADQGEPEKLKHAETPDDAPDETASAAESEQASEDDEDEEEDEEPKLKYSRLTANLSPVYRSGDATSASTVAGDKMIIGTHNGNIHVVSLPSFQPLRLYHAHSASVSAVSVSPFLPLLPNFQTILPPQQSHENLTPPKRTPSVNSDASASPRAPKQVQAQVPITPSNSIYIATSSIDGHVCVSSLVDPKDVTLRNFARPVQAVALSPDYKNDRSYLSGGLAGNLILTVGGRTGVSSNANTNSAAAAASGWLGSLGIGSNTGKDTVLHSSEGTISIIKWSLSGKFAMWTNEHGIRILRTNVDLESADLDSAWKRIGIIERPNRRAWEEMASVWKARAEWVDDANLEVDDDDTALSTSTLKPASSSIEKSGGKKKKKKPEKLVVGWGDCAWVIHVHPGGAGTGKNAGERSAGSASIVHHLRFEDCIVSGLSLYTPSLLLILAYRTRDDNDNPITSLDTSPKRGIQHRQNGLSPELKLIEAATGDEVEVDALTVSRFQSLSAADYHLSTLYVPHPQAVTPAQRSALEAIGGGLWDVGVSATRIFSSGASIMSLPSSGDNVRQTSSQSSTNGQMVPAKKISGVHPAASSPGLKIFIQSPYDCVLAVKRDLGDHLNWLIDHKEYKDAWELVEDHPEVVSISATDRNTDTTPTGTSSKIQQSLVEFFADDAASETTISVNRVQNSAVEKEKRRIGDLWVQQLVNAGNWAEAAEALGKTLSTSSRFEHWFWTFAQAKKFDEIAPHIPSKPLQPPLSSALYERVLGHYLYVDRIRMRDLLDHWEGDLFTTENVIEPIKKLLASGDVTEKTTEGGEEGRDWRLLQDALAKLYLANGQLRDALRCYIRLQNAEAAMALIRENHLLEAIHDDIPGFILLRVSREQIESAPLSELEELSSEAIHILVDEAHRGVVRPDDVVEQLQRKDVTYNPFLFFYLRSLWKGEGTQKQVGHTADRFAGEGRAMVEDHGDLAVELFAEYDRTLFMEVLRSSQRYRLEKATAVCELRQYIPELVFLLSKTGETKKALFLIIDKLSDVSGAIAFAKEQDDHDLWDDLLDYSMDKPRFIRGLLEEVGTAIDPITLVRRIPEGLEIEGLREGIGRMVREYEIQFSISEGVAKVLQGEVASGMDLLRAGQKVATKFEIVHEPAAKVEVHAEPVVPAESGESPNQPKELDLFGHTKDKAEEPIAGYCVGCRRIFAQDEKETLLGFACTHVYHLSCLLSANEDNANGDQDSSAAAAAAAAAALQSQFAADTTDDLGAGYSSRSVGAKVAHAHVIRRAVPTQGCTYCASKSLGRN